MSMEDREILWKPDQNTVYVADFEKMFGEAVAMIWPQVFRNEYGVHFVYKLNRGHCMKGRFYHSLKRTWYSDGIMVMVILRLSVFIR